MGKGRITDTLIKSLAFALIVFSLSACVTATKPQGKGKVLHDVVVFRDLQEIDLDNDGIKDTIALYTTNTNSTGVKVINYRNDKGNVIYEHVFDSLQDVKLVISRNTPKLIIETKDKATGCKTRDIYRWDGKAFMPAGK